MNVTAPGVAAGPSRENIGERADGDLGDIPRGIRAAVTARPVARSVGPPWSAQSTVRPDDAVNSYDTRETAPLRADGPALAAPETSPLADLDSFCSIHGGRWDIMERLRPGDPVRLGGFRILGRLGEGGQGVVYLGHSAAGEPVAIKVMRRDHDERSRARFVREAAAGRRVARFCTAAVLVAEVDGERPFIVCEYIAGPSLRNLVRRHGPRRGVELEWLAMGMATALAAIHYAASCTGTSSRATC